MTLQALRPNQNRAPVSKTFTLPAPLGGLNTRDPLAHMKPQYALTMDNFFPEANYIALRRGFIPFATGVGTGVIQSLMTYRAQTGVEKLFAGAGGKIYDCSTAGAASISYSTAITVNKWQTVNFSNIAGLHLLAVNGTDAPLNFSGSAWSAASLSGSITSTSSINSLINVWQHKERLWFCQKNTLDLWYLASQAISGALTRFPLGGVANKGGQIVAGGTFSFDAGAGVDDYLVAVTDNGEAIVYQGTNPATDFAIVGVFDVGQTVGQRCLTKIGGDLVILTTQGALPLSKMINNDRAKADSLSVTSLISESFNMAIRTYKDNFGWEGIVYPKGRWALFNVPQSEGISQIQYVQNVITGAWCTFSNMNANCWGLFNDNLYFGGNGGTVYKADLGETDVSDEITGELKTAFNYCGSSGNKFFKALRPFMLSPGTSEILADIDVDFGDDDPTNSFAEGGGTPGTWDLAIWDTASWQSATLPITKWQTTGRIGACAAAHIIVTGSGGQVQVNDFDLLYEPAMGQIF